MKWIATFCLSILFLLILGGVWHYFDDQGLENGTSFYSYRFGQTLEELDGVPFWIIALCLHSIIHGVFFIRWVIPRTSEEGEGVDVPLMPLKLVGLNLIMAPVLIVAHILARAFHL